MENPVIILGAGPVGLQALDIFTKNEVVVYGFLDDDTKLHGTEINDISVLGATDDEGYTKLIGKKCEAFVATDDTKLKKSISDMLHDRRHIMPVNAIHPSASIASSASLGHGNLLGAQAILGANTNIGNHCNIFAGAIIDVGTTIADFVQIGIGANIGAKVEIGVGVFIGAGATVVSGVKIGKNARIGAGSVVIADIGNNETVFGNPAAKVGK